MANAKVTLIRLDTRMVHGAVVKGWAKAVNTKRVMMIDTLTDSDPFMANFYRKGKNRGFKIDVTSAQKAAADWQAEKFGPEGKKTMVMVKDIDELRTLIEGGFPIPELNIGKVNYDTGKAELAQMVFFYEEEFQVLRDLHDQGTRIYIQVAVGDDPMEWDQVVAAFEEGKAKL